MVNVSAGSACAPRGRCIGVAPAHACAGMELRAGTVEVGVFGAFGHRLVARCIDVAVGGLALMGHKSLSENGVQLPLLPLEGLRLLAEGFAA